MEEIFEKYAMYYGALLALIVVFWCCISYTANYKKTTCDTSVSPDGEYELTLQAIGEPEWPFGSARGKLILKNNENTISETGFEIRNDGGSVNERCWKVTWYETYAEVTLSGKEQFDERVTLYFDGSVDMQQITEEDDDYATVEEAYAIVIGEYYSAAEEQWDSAALMDAVLNYLVPHWDCIESNRGSIHLAESVGFTKINERPFHWFDI